MICARVQRPIGQAYYEVRSLHGVPGKEQCTNAVNLTVGTSNIATLALVEPQDLPPSFLLSVADGLQVAGAMATLALYCWLLVRFARMAR